METADLVRLVSGVVAPIVVSTIVLLAGAYAVRRYAGPAQSAYTDAIEGRVKLLMSERDDYKNALDALKVEVETLRKRVVELERQVRELTAENADLLREATGRPPVGRSPRARP